ncbi:hypothetical protein AB1303_01940 [Saccharolobus solfataricus]
METITIDEKTLYNLTQPSEVIEELTHLNGNLTLVPNILLAFIGKSLHFYVTLKIYNKSFLVR